MTFNILMSFIGFQQNLSCEGYNKFFILSSVGYIFLLVVSFLVLGGIKMKSKNLLTLGIYLLGIVTLYKLSILIYTFWSRDNSLYGICFTQVSGNNLRWIDNLVDLFVVVWLFLETKRLIKKQTSK